MLEEYKEQNQTSVVSTWNNIPYGLISDDLELSEKEKFYAEMNEINELYELYNKGADFLTEGSAGDYIPSQLRFKKSKTILDKEVRFLFSTPPDVTVNYLISDNSKIEQSTILQELINNILKESKFNSKLIKACKDCFIGKRVALVANFNEEDGIKIYFYNSLSFIFKYDDENDDKLIKFATYVNLVNTWNRKEQRYFKKTYVLKDDGHCWLKEEIFDGLGDLVEVVNEEYKTELSFIPAVIIRNGGLTNDVLGESELQHNLEYESAYSRLSNADIDSQRKGMNPTKYTIDASSNSTQNLSTGPGAYWDIVTDEMNDKAVQAKVGIIEPSMGYSTSLSNTLDRIENTMYSEVDVPNITSEKLQGVVTSGKTLNALYWSLSVRCDEKMLVWGDAIETLVKMIIEGAKLYPDIASKNMSYGEEIPNIDYNITVINNYALLEDEKEEKQIDLSEINALAMSKKTYMKKWRKMSDEEIENELMQIKREQDLMENDAIVNQDDTVDYQDDDYETEDDVSIENMDDEDDDNLEDSDDLEIDVLFDDIMKEINS